MAADQARNRLFVLVRDFATQTPGHGLAIRYFTKPDERKNIRLVAGRVYGDYNESLVIQAAAGLDSPEHELTERMLVLPTRTQLLAMKERAGYGL